MTNFYTFRQNNSGGTFTYDRYAGIGVYVIIEATSAKKANDIAEDLGLYFNGVDDGFDCECCGDRWYSVSDNEATKQPEIYGDLVGEIECHKLSANSFIHYLSGTIKPFRYD